jgi:hypothetical protein
MASAAVLEVGLSPQHVNLLKFLHGHLTLNAIWGFLSSRPFIMAEWGVTSHVLGKSALNLVTIDATSSSLKAAEDFSRSCMILRNDSSRFASMEMVGS